MRNFTKLFTTSIHKKITVLKNDKTGKYDLSMSFKVSDHIILFEGICKEFHINQEFGSKSLAVCVKMSMDCTIVIIKSQCQIRTFVENDEIVRLSLERLGEEYNGK